MSPEFLMAILQALEAGIPLDHGNRTDARITQLEEAVKMILTMLTAPSQSDTPTKARVTTPSGEPNP